MPSERDWLAAREFRQFVKEEAERIRVNEDAAQYQTYVEQIEVANGNCAPAERVEPISFNAWRKLIPAELQDAPPALRGATATANSNMSRLAAIAIDRLKRAELTDRELATLGFDPEDRVWIAEVQLSVPAIVDIFNRFTEREPRYVKKLHYEPIIDFLSRNRLVPSERHVGLTFNHLLGVGAIALPEPEPQPERPAGLNEHGVNLHIEIDPAIEARKRREKYEREIIVVDPATGKGWTNYMLDFQADSETYRRLMRIPRICKNPALEPQH